jgi:hypothetical protein
VTRLSSIRTSRTGRDRIPSPLQPRLVALWFIGAPAITRPFRERVRLRRVLLTRRIIESRARRQRAMRSSFEKSNGRRR